MGIGIGIAASSLSSAATATSSASIRFMTSALTRSTSPTSPTAAADLSVQAAWLLVLLFAVAGLSIVASNFGPFISSLYCLGLFLGTIYSVPPFRLKRYPIAAFLIISIVCGFLLTFGVYYATRAALGLPFQWSFQ